MRTYSGLVLGLALALAGCGKNTYPVEGKIVFADGTPVKELAGGRVEFQAEGPGLASPRGDIRADGTFTLSTSRPGDGAAPGKYRVLLMPPPRTGFDQRPPPIVDRRFHSFDTSGLTATIEPRANDVTLTVERAGTKD